MMKKKCMALMLSAFMMATAMPIVTAPSSNDSAITASAVETESAIKNGDLVTVTKQEFGIPLEPYVTSLPGSIEDYVTLYCSQLTPNGELSNMFTLSRDNAEVSKVGFRYYSSYVYMIERQYKETGAAGNNWHWEKYILDPDKGEWVKYDYLAKGQSADVAIKEPIRFTQGVLGLTYDMIPDTEVMTVHSPNGTTFTVPKGEESPLVSADYANYTWEANVDYTEHAPKTSCVTTGKVYGTFIANIPIVTKKDLHTFYVANEEPDKNNGGISEPQIIQISFPETDVNGDIICDKDNNPIINNLEDIEHGNAYLLKGTEVIQEISVGDLKHGAPAVVDYDKNYPYFLKVAIDSSNKEFMYFKYNPDNGWWDFRVNTKETPMYNVSIGLETFPDEFTSGNLYSSDADTKDLQDNNIVNSWTKEEFGNGGKDVTILTNCENKVFTALFDYGKNGGIRYEFVGIDPVVVSSYGNRAHDTSKIDSIFDTSVPTDAKSDDKIHVVGTEPDGTKVDYTVKQNYDKDDMKLGDGDYTITNETTGIVAEVKDGEIINPNEDGTLNLTTPVEKNVYKIYDPSNEVVAEGNLKGEAPISLKNLVTDAGLPTKQVEWLKDIPYLKYETESGVINSVNPEDFVKDSNYFVVNTSKNAKAGDITVVTVNDVVGDVNQDGKFNVADLVMEQNYLLNSLTSKDKFGVENFIAGNVMTDGEIDVFDMITLRQLYADKT